jgi:hypothetical protein
MFPRNKVTGVSGGKIRTQVGQQELTSYASRGRQYQENKTQVTASLGGFSGSGAGNSLSINSYWSSQYQYMMTGLIAAEPSYSDSSQLALFYRDIYLHDHTAGSAVDIQSSFPFSDFDLRGLDENMIQVYKESLDQLNISQMLPIISTAYLVDGFFCGSLVFDPNAKRFLDTLVHDALQCQVIPNAFFNMMPTINVQTGTQTLRLLQSDSIYNQEYVNSLPRSFVDMLRQGDFTLNPISTLFVARRTLTDRAYVSFLHRILPMYLIEKTMFRGTLVEASRRQRATTHLTAGDDVWTPTGEELQALVSQFQQAEFDPLGGWVSTRSSVQANDLRPGGDFWKWTDMADILVPYKLRAMGISESFLSGDASYAAAESALSTFLETQNTYRNHLTNAVFTSTLFPLIAVANGFYTKDAQARVERGQISKFLMHAKNRSGLAMPQLVWHKSLEAKGEENTFEMLEQASEKGVPIPLKNWMAAAGLDSDTLLKDMKDDVELRKKLEKYTGKDTSHEGEEGTDEVNASARPTTQSIKAGAMGKRSILGREWKGPEDYVIGKTGNRHSIPSASQPRMKMRDYNGMVAKIANRALHDENYRMQLAKANMEKMGYTTIPGAGDIPVRR